jgi:hypothetical protein
MTQTFANDDLTLATDLATLTFQSTYFQEIEALSGNVFLIFLVVGCVYPTLCAVVFSRVMNSSDRCYINFNARRYQARDSNILGIDCHERYRHAPSELG